MQQISASTLYDVSRCPHRVFMDRTCEPDKRDPVDGFSRLLWEHGIAHRSSVVSNICGPLVDLSDLRGDEKERATRASLAAGAQLVYSGRLTHDDLVGEPDLLRNGPKGYEAGDIRYGSASSDDELRPKDSYAVQLCLYTDILERRGISSGRTAFILDRDGVEVQYDLMRPRSSRSIETYWDEYLAVLQAAIRIGEGSEVTSAALTGHCKQCHWSTVCRSALVQSDDLTLIPEVGRSTRDQLVGRFPTVSRLAATSKAELLSTGEALIPGVGPKTLLKLWERSRLLSVPSATPYCRRRIDLPPVATEVFLDIEDDPLSDHCYLHGFCVRHVEGSTEHFAFYSDEATPEGEQQAYRDAWDLVRALPGDAPIYVYSAHEKAWWRRLQSRHADVCSIEEVEALFADRVIDLYTDVVRPMTEWPTYDHSVKSIARFLGFEWRDANPSGAASIAWYADWVRTRDSAIRSRILQYNEGDCRALITVLDGLRALPLLDSHGDMPS